MVIQNMTVKEAVLHFGNRLFPPHRREDGQEISFNLDDAKRKKFYYNFYCLLTQNKIQVGPWNPHKGLCLMGKVGVGKSAMFMVYQQMYHSYKIIKCKTIENEYKELLEAGVKFPMIQLLEKYGKKFEQEILFDELGGEKTELKLFGNADSIMAEILMDRSDLFVEKGIRTYITTNFDEPTLQTVYGGRLMDRFFQMFNMITWEGKSLR